MEEDFGAAAGGAFELEPAAQAFQAVPQAGETHGPGVDVSGIEAAPVVFDAEFQSSGLPGRGDQDFRGAGMFDDVIEGLAAGEQEAAALVQGERPWRDRLPHRSRLRGAPGRRRGRG